MIKFLKHLLIIISFSLYLHSANGQGQPGFDKSVTDKFLNFCQVIPREEIFVHTDRDEYIAGEDVWFNIFLIDRQSSKPSSESKIAYFELLNNENRPVVQERIRLEKGSGPGQIVLPDTLSTGNYTLRVYTNWMRNFLPFNCFMKNLRIYNAISSKTLAGRSDRSYSTSTNDGALISKTASEQGFTQKVNNLKPDTLEIILNTDEKFRSVNGNICHLFIQAHGIPVLSGTVILTGMNTKIPVSKKLLKEGINQITTFDSEGRPVGDRYIYIPFRESKYLSLKSLDSCTSRDKQSIEIEFNKEILPSLKDANLSISVAPKTNLNETSDLAGYLVFGSEFGIIPEEIRNSNINELSPEILDNFLLTVKSNWIDWSVILSGNYPVPGYKAEYDNHLLYGRLINKNSEVSDSGKYIFMSSPGKAAVFQYAKTDENGTFSFTLPINEGAKDIIIQPEEVSRNTAVRIESSFSDKYLPHENSSSSEPLVIPSYISKWSVNFQVSKIYGSVFARYPAKATISSPKPKRFYGKPDIELKLADYIKLPVMSEVFFEIMPGVFLKNRKSVYEITIADPVTNAILRNPPVLFIDGVKIDDASLIANLDPEIVEEIDAIKERYMVGDYLFYGLVNVITKSGDFSAINLPAYAVRFPYKVFDPVSTFTEPEYTTPEMKQSRVPDFRNTLYWNPSVIPDNDNKARVEFWTSDYSSVYEINIQGITADGKILSCKKLIKVK